MTLAKDITSRGTYSYVKRCPGAVAPGTTEASTVPVPVPESKWRTIDRENTMLRTGFATAHYHMGSHGLDTNAKADPYRVQRWQGIVFANDPMARIGFDGKSGGKNYISNPFKTIQDRNVMVTMKWAPDAPVQGVDPNLWVHFSPTLDAVEEQDGWIFVRSGEAFAAVKVVAGGYKWERSWKHLDTFRASEKSFISLNSDVPIITVANDASDYHHDFAAFKEALKAQPISYAHGVLQFATITHDGPLAPGKVNGRAVGLRPSQVYESPFIRSEWDSGVIYIRKANETLILDFSNRKTPVKTVGPSPALTFPAGIGDAHPIIFGERTR